MNLNSMDVNKVTRVVLVRHGQTEWNNGARFQGHTDSPLTQIGERQAQALGKRLAGERFAAVFSSDLGRARRTAEIIAEHTGHTVKTDARLRERGLGIFEGLRRDEIEARFPEESRKYYSRQADYAVPGGESAMGRFRLGLECLNELAERHSSGTILVVTHGGLVQGMFRHVTGLPFEAPRRFSIRNAAYNVFAYGEYGWSLEIWGDTSHFPSDLLQPLIAPVDHGTRETFTP